MVVQQPSKLRIGVRFPLPAPYLRRICAHSFKGAVHIWFLLCPVWRELSKVFFLSFASGFCGLFKVIELPKMDRSTASSNAGLPLFLAGMPTNPGDPTGVVSLRSHAVVAVLLLAALTKVFGPVIGRITVDVVDLIFRPSAVRHRKYNPMCPYRYSIDADSAINFFEWYGRDTTSRDVMSGRNLPLEQTVIATHEHLVQPIDSWKFPLHWPASASRRRFFASAAWVSSGVQ